MLTFTKIKSQLRTARESKQGIWLKEKFFSYKSFFLENILLSTKKSSSKTLIIIQRVFKILMLNSKQKYLLLKSEPNKSF